MESETSSMLRQLFDTRPVAALATLHKGEPSVSMVPFVLPRGDDLIAIHVSALATHTADMLAHSRVGLLVMSEPHARTSPQALPRVSLQADALQLPRGGEVYEQARGHYLARFPDAGMTFELPDFSIFLLRPVSARLIAGFGHAFSLVGDGLQEWLRRAPSAAGGGSG
jgi:putative heme iron utilization protein